MKPEVYTWGNKNPTVSFAVSKDGKTVKVDGKELSLGAFKKQYAFLSGNMGPTNRGQAMLRSEAKPPIKISSKTADEAKSKADKKAAKQSSKALKATRKPLNTPSAIEARKAAEERARKVAPEKRSQAQKLATTRTWRAGGGGGITGPFGIKNR